MAKSLIKGVKNSQWIRVIMEGQYQVDVQVGKLDTIRPLAHRLAVWSGLEDLVRNNQLNPGNGGGQSSYFYDDQFNRHPYQVQFYIL